MSWICDWLHILCEVVHTARVCLTVIFVALLRALTQSTRSCWSLACRKNFLIPALMTNSSGNKRKSEYTFRPLHITFSTLHHLISFVQNKNYMQKNNWLTHWKTRAQTHCQISLKVKNNRAKGPHTHYHPPPPCAWWPSRIQQPQPATTYTLLAVTQKKTAHGYQAPNIRPPMWTWEKPIFNHKEIFGSNAD